MAERVVVGGVAYVNQGVLGYIAAVALVVMVLANLEVVEEEQKSVEAAVEAAVVLAMAQVVAFSPHLDPVQHLPGYLMGLTLQPLLSWVSSLLRYRRPRPMHPLIVRNEG